MDAPASKTPGRNEPCHCGSGRKYKQCCLDADEKTAREARAKAQAEAAAAAPAEGEAEEPVKPGRPHGRQPMEKTFGGPHANSRGFQKTTGTRKVGGG